MFFGFLVVFVWVFFCLSVVLFFVVVVFFFCFFFLGGGVVLFLSSNTNNEKRGVKKIILGVLLATLTSLRICVCQLHHPLQCQMVFCFVFPSRPLMLLVVEDNTYCHIKKKVCMDRKSITGE